MGVLFLDPLALGLLLGLLTYVWLVWRGTFRRWFGRSEAWTVVAWPIPLLIILVPPLAGGLLWLADRIGIEIGDGAVADALLYAAVYLVPAVTAAVWTPRLLLPGWARRRLTPLPGAPDPKVPAGAVPAVQGRRGHGSHARWVWRVDGVAGHVWVDGRILRFRATAAAAPAARFEVDEEFVAGLRFADDDGFTLAAPQGGWWSAGRVDAELDEVDRVRAFGALPWRRDGRLTVEVVGRRPLHLWVADIRRLQRLLTEGGGPPAPDADREGDDRG